MPDDEPTKGKRALKPKPRTRPEQFAVIAASLPAAMLRSPSEAERRAQLARARHLFADLEFWIGEMEAGEADRFAGEAVDRMFAARYEQKDADNVRQRHVVEAIIRCRRTSRREGVTPADVASVRAAGHGLEHVEDAMIEAAIVGKGSESIGVVLAAAGDPITEAMIDVYAYPRRRR